MLPFILDYLVHLKQLTVSSIRVQSRLFTHGWAAGLSSQNQCGHFLKGLGAIIPPGTQPLPHCDLSLLLASLTGSPFELLAMCSLLYLSWKVAFLVAITSARRISEIWALTLEPPYTVSFKDKFQLWPHLAFLPKVVLQFPGNQGIFLPVIYPKPHANREGQRLYCLDGRHELAFYIERTFRIFSQLCLAIADKMKGLPVLAQIILSWIASCICTCYSKEAGPLEWWPKHEGEHMNV